VQLAMPQKYASSQTPNPNAYADIARSRRREFTEMIKARLVQMKQKLEIRIAEKPAVHIVTLLSPAHGLACLDGAVESVLVH
jgi:hypothetical protein